MAQNTLLQGSPFIGQLILDPYRRLAEYPPLDDSLLLETLEPSTEHPVADVRNGVTQLGESLGSGQHFPHDRA